MNFGWAASDCLVWVSFALARACGFVYRLRLERISGRLMVFSGKNRGMMAELGLALACLALLMKALMPAGYMLSSEIATLNGWSITLCTGYGPVQARVEADGGLTLLADAETGHLPDAGNAHSAPCAFTALAALWVAAFASVYFAPLAAADDGPAITPQLFTHGLAASPTALRGPPASL